MEGLLMTKTCNDNELVSIDSSNHELLATPSRIDLKHIDDVRLEMAKVYREMKQQKIPAQDGTRLVYVLTQIGKMIELHDIEKRINRIEECL
jgi:hypothetical protein|tara:strand:+ start:216 stop:491 length:276 start_codon:yes stop_codon:yes gene_type:complete